MDEEQRDDQREFENRKAQDFLQAIQAQQNIMGSGFGTHDGAIMAGDNVDDRVDEQPVESLSDFFKPIDAWSHAWATEEVPVQIPRLEIPTPEVPGSDEPASIVTRQELSAEFINQEMQELAVPLPMEGLGGQANPPEPIPQLPPFLQQQPEFSFDNPELSQDLWLGMPKPDDRSAERMSSSVNLATPIPEAVTDPPGFPGDQPVSFNSRMQMGFRQDASDTLDDFNNAFGDFLREFVDALTQVNQNINQMRDILAAEVPPE